MRRVTVLGATGFIGAHLGAELRRRGYLVWTPPRDADLTAGPLGTVFYCIGLPGGDAPVRPFETVAAHVCKLADVLRRGQFDSLLYLSSTRLYLGAPTGDEEETIRANPLQPTDLYNLSKAMGESLALQSGRPVRVVRLANVYGPHWKSENFLPSVIRAAWRDGVVTLRTALTSAKDYVHIEDVVSLLIRIGLDGSRPVYNLASGRNVTHAEIAERLQALTGCAVQAEPGLPVVVFPPIGTARLRAEFPFVPRSVLSDLPWLVELYRHEPEQPDRGPGARDRHGAVPSGPG